MSNIYADRKAQRINWDRKVKYVMNEESSPAGQALTAAIYGLPNASNYDGWLNILTQVETSEMGLGDYIRSIS